MTLTFAWRLYQSHVNHCVTFNVEYLGNHLRAHGLSDAALQEVYRSVVVARLLYAASAWHAVARVHESV